jgi:hypothetical protein
MGFRQRRPEECVVHRDDNPDGNPYGGPVGEPVDPYADAYLEPYPTPYPSPYPSPAPYASFGPVYGPGGVRYPQQAGPAGAPPAPPNPYGYTPYDSRPAPVLAAGVLAYVLAGVLIAGGLLLVFGASSLYVLASADASMDLPGATGELAVAGLVNLIVAAVLITGGVLFGDARRRQRTLLAVGAALTLAECVYWLARTDADTGIFFLCLVYGTLAAGTLVMAYSIQSGRWLAGAPAAHSPATVSPDRSS